MQILLILFIGLFGNTEFFNTHGKKIGEDKHGKDGTVAIITDKKTAKIIAQDYKNGGLVTKINPKLTIETTRIVLEEALHTLRRTENNGGLREECSIVTTEGKIIRAETGGLPNIINGVQVAKVILPNFTKRHQTLNATSIHSHPLKIQVESKFFYPQAIHPSFNTDLWIFPKYGTNIIVGNISQSYEVTRKTLRGEEKYSTTPLKGIAIYKKGKGDKPILVLSKKNVEKIIE